GRFAAAAARALRPERATVAGVDEGFVRGSNHRVTEDTEEEDTEKTEKRIRGKCPLLLSLLSRCLLCVLCDSVVSSSLLLRQLRRVAVVDAQPSLGHAQS